MTEPSKWAMEAAGLIDEKNDGVGSWAEIDEAAAIIDRAFAPLVEENARLRELLRTAERGLLLYVVENLPDDENAQNYKLVSAIQSWRRDARAALFAKGESDGT